MFRNRGLTAVLAVVAAAAMLPAAAQAQRTPAARSVKSTPTPSPTPRQYTPDEFFAKVDRNGDGRVTRQEMQIFGMENKLGALINTRTWKRVDKDRNGWLSKKEFSDQLVKVRAKAAKPRR